MPRRDPEKAVLMLDMLLEFFGEIGHRWAAGIRHDNFGGRCLLDAMAHLRRVMDVHGDPTRFYLHRAMPLTDQRIEDFNDFALTYDEIRTVIVAAREIAQAELDAARDRLRTNRRLQPDQRAIARAGEISCRGSRQSGGGDLRSLIPRACGARRGSTSPAG